MRDDPTIPEELRARMGSLSVETSLAKVREFVEAGGTVVAIGSSTRIGEQLELPVSSALVDEEGKALGRGKFFVPGSLLRMRIDTSHPLALGMPEYADVMFRRSPVLKVGEGAERIAWYDSETPLRSGWAWGQEVLKDGVAAAAFSLGKGRVVLYAPEITFRAQPHGTFKLLFNAIVVGE